MRENPPALIYLDNAATSYPKPQVVAEAISAFLSSSAGNPGRSGHSLAVAAQSMVSGTRRELAHFFGISDPSRLVFTLNATDALNQALWGLLKPGDRVITTGLEHNSVARPLNSLAKTGVEVSYLPGSPEDGMLDLDLLSEALKTKSTRLVVMTHASNVTGTIMPIEESARLAHEYGALFLLDAAQTAGVLPIDVEKLGLDLLAFPGHKGLLGPTGTGGLYVSPPVHLRPLRQGGTGTRSELDTQPEDLPEGLEAGTVNTVGIAGLRASLRYLTDLGVEKVWEHEKSLTQRLIAGLSEVSGLRIHGPKDTSRQVSTVSVSLEGWEPVDLGAALDSSYCICSRPGLHCAPLAHRTLGTFPQGTVRLSPGVFTTEEEIDLTIAAFRDLAGA